MPLFVTRLLKSGGKILEKAVCENLCHSCNSCTSQSTATGSVHNPFAVGYSSGGSCSGSAALVDSGIVDIEIGANQGGSVCIPAAWCLQSECVIPFTGRASTNDHLGLTIKDVLKNAKALQAVTGSDNRDDRGFNVITENYFDELAN